MANASNKCAHAGCQCSVSAGQTYCSPSCQQQAQQADVMEQMSRAAANAGKIPKDSPMMGLLGER